MRRSAPRFFLLGLLSVGTFIIVACGADDATPSIPNVTPQDSGIVFGATDSGGDAPPVDAADAADAMPVTCPDVLPDDTTGVYVAATGGNSGTCGTITAPCKTVATGIVQAMAASKAKVYLAAGTYEEKLTLTAGIELVGGWQVTGAVWKRACTTPGQLSILKAPAAQNTTVAAADLGGEAKLTLLRVESKAAASVLPGESIYGVFATGSSTILTLTDVTVDVVAAGAGVAPTKGAVGTPATGVCATGTGVVGTAGAAGTGAVAGTFDVTGYTPSLASIGGAGAAGNNGIAGGAAACAACGVCSAFTDVPACTFTANAAQTCGTLGSSGCGGGPGAVGAPGTGGGSSIGIYAWDATIAISGGAVTSGAGGDGAAGAAGGTGGAGSAGVAGLAAGACITVCGAAGVLACGANTTVAPAGGTAGGTGGAGGAGGTGGGGGGGSSYATYQGDTGLVTLAGAATFTHGKAGAAGGAGASISVAGTAADHFP